MRWTETLVRTAATAGFVMLACVAARANGLIPVHGFVLAPPHRGHLLMRLDRVVDTMPAGVYAVATGTSGTPPPPGTEVDALVTRAPDGLVLQGSPIAAERFIAGTPNRDIKRTLTAGDAVPAYTLVDQRGRAMRLDAFAGRVTILSFVFSRCPDATVCPAISGKFLYLQRHLDPGRFHLVEVTLDPAYDSPAVLAAYGRRFDADPRMWSIVTGEPAQVKDVMDSFGLSSFEDGTDNYIHDVRIVLIDGKGIVRDVVQTADWSPDDVIAAASAMAGLQSNPLRLFWFATIANVIAFCGGNQSVGTLIFTVAVVGLMCSISIPLVVWVGRRMFSEKKKATRISS